MSLTDNQQAAAFHGLATNEAMSTKERLAYALQALDWYEADRERTQPVVEAAKAWRGVRANTPTRPKPESAALIAAVDRAEVTG